MNPASMKNLPIARQTIILILVLFCAAAVYPQEKTIIRGRVVDQSDQTPIIGANIIEYDSDNRIINGTISDINGDFVLEMKDPGHAVKISVIGVKKKP